MAPPSAKIANHMLILWEIEDGGPTQDALDEMPLAAMSLYIDIS